MRRGLGNERGQSLIEFSVVVLVVLTVIFGVLETGRLMLAYITVAEAARAGVRYGIVNGADVNTAAAATTAVQTTVQNVGTAAGLTLPAPTVCYSVPPATSCGTNDAVGSAVKVTVSYTFVPVAPLVSRLGVTISSTSEGTICF